MRLAESFNPTVLYGGAGAFLAALVAVLWYAIQLMRRGLKQSDGQQTEINGLRVELTAQQRVCDERIGMMERDHKRRLDDCEKRERKASLRLNVLIGACHASGVKVPDAIFED